jgi:hypothetical protein
VATVVAPVTAAIVRPTAPTGASAAASGDRIGAIIVSPNESAAKPTMTNRPSTPEITSGSPKIT